MWRFSLGRRANRPGVSTAARRRHSRRHEGPVDAVASPEIFLVAQALRVLRNGIATYGWAHDRLRIGHPCMQRLPRSASLQMALRCQRLADLPGQSDGVRLAISPQHFPPCAALVPVSYAGARMGLASRRSYGMRRCVQMLRCRPPCAWIAASFGVVGHVEVAIVVGYQLSCRRARHLPRGLTKESVLHERFHQPLQHTMPGCGTTSLADPLGTWSVWSCRVYPRVGDRRLHAGGGWNSALSCWYYIKVLRAFADCESTGQFSIDALRALWTLRLCARCCRCGAMGLCDRGQIRSGGGRCLMCVGSSQDARLRIVATLRGRLTLRPRGAACHSWA